MKRQTEGQDSSEALKPDPTGGPETRAGRLSFSPAAAAREQVTAAHKSLRMLAETVGIHGDCSVPRAVEGAGIFKSGRPGF